MKTTPAKINVGSARHCEYLPGSANKEAPMRVVTLQHLHQHVFDLWGKADGIEWTEPGYDAVAYHDTQTIRIHPITSEAAYATALHEIGHIRILRTIRAIGALPLAPIRQSDASSLGDAEVQALCSSQDPRKTTCWPRNAWRGIGLETMPWSGRPRWSGRLSDHWGTTH